MGHTCYCGDDGVGGHTCYYGDDGVGGGAHVTMVMMVLGEGHMLLW